jgi:hypothetical protein
VRAPVGKNIIQPQDYIIVYCFFRAAGIIQPVVFHYIRKIAGCHYKVELLCCSALWWMKKFNGQSKALHQALIKGSVSII